MPLVHPTPEQVAALRRVADSEAFVHAVCAAVAHYLTLRDRERSATPKAARRRQLAHLEKQVRATRQSLRRLSPEARGALNTADLIERGGFTMTYDAGVIELDHLLASVRRAQSIDRPTRGGQRDANARALGFWLVCALEAEGIPATPGEGGPLDFTARVAVEMIGDDAPDLRTILRNE